MGQLLLTMLISSKHCHKWFSILRRIFLFHLYPSHFFSFSSSLKNPEAGFFFLFSSHFVIALGAYIPCSSLYPFFLIDPWQVSIILAEMLIRFLYLFGLVYHHCASVLFFFSSHRLLSLLLLLTLLTYTLLLRFINKQKNWHKGEGRSQGLVGFFFFFFFGIS